MIDTDKLPAARMTRRPYGLAMRPHDLARGASASTARVSDRPGGHRARAHRGPRRVSRGGRGLDVACDWGSTARWLAMPDLRTSSSFVTGIKADLIGQALGGKPRQSG
jgi:hypothetical protein